MSANKYTLRRVGSNAAPAQAITLASQLRPFFIGAQGVPGKSAYQVALETGFEGSPGQWLESLAQEASQIAAASAAQAEADAAQTGLDRVQTGSDRVATGADRAQTALDRAQTGADRVATAADRVQAGADAQTATTQAGIATTRAGQALASQNAAAGSAADAAADRVQTGLDRAATGLDRAQTGLDAATATSKAGEASASAATASAKASEASASAASAAADRVQTGLDRAATGSDATASGLSAATATAQAGIATTKALESSASAAASQASASATAFAVVDQLNNIKSQTEAIRDQAMDGLGAADNSQALSALLGSIVYATDMALKGLDGISENRGTFGSTDRAELFAYMFGELLDKIGVIGRAISGGTIELQGGTAAIPSLTSATDVATGVFFPANGVVAVATAALERLRITADGRLGLGTNAPSGLLDVADNKLRVRTAQTPASATAAGNQGEWAWDANFVYVCINTNTWRRAALTTW